MGLEFGRFQGNSVHDGGEDAFSLAGNGSEGDAGDGFLLHRNDALHAYLPFFHVLGGKAGEFVAAPHDAQPAMFLVQAEGGR